MTGAVDTSREACERLAVEAENEARWPWGSISGASRYRKIARTLRGLRAALDPAERESAENRALRIGLWAALNRSEQCRATADATGYARGVRDAAERALSRPLGIPTRYREAASAVILDLLPATEKEKNDAE